MINVKREKQNGAALENAQLTGQFDFLLKVASRDMKQYNAFLMDKLATLPNISGVETMFVLSEGKVETAYSLEVPVAKKKKPII